MKEEASAKFRYCLGRPTRSPHPHTATKDQMKPASVHLSSKKKRIGVGAVLAVAALGITTLCVLFGPALWEFASNTQNFRSWVDAYGFASRLLFVGANALQVVIAFLPGEPLELAAGYMFGFWEGTLWCMIASLVGTVMVVTLVRSVGMRIVNVFFSTEKISSLRWLQDSQRFEMLLFMCFLIPGTPKDILTYVAALGNSPAWRIVAITTIGRIPSIISSTFVAGCVGEGNYTVALVVGATTAALALAGMLKYRGFAKPEA